MRNPLSFLLPFAFLAWVTLCLGVNPSLERTVIPFAEDGGWCWFQDPRVIIHDDHLFIGAVKGNETGPALVTVWNLQTNTRVATIELMDGFDHDDHNAPAFYVRSDGSVMAMIARHSTEKFHYYSISESADYTEWSDITPVDHSEFLEKEEDKVTYMNLFPLSKEGKVYNFFRGVEFNPCFVISDDDGLSWGDGTHFIQSEIKGRHRPYARYKGDGVDTIHVAFTDAHPRQFGNSLYYAAFRDGQFYRADGTLIKNLQSDGALKPSEAELLFEGSGQLGKGQRGSSAPESSWVSDVQYDRNGYPHIAYSLYHSNEDLRYRVVSWNGEKWIDREVAYAGHCLYGNETSYTGLISLDPMDPSMAVISTDVDPETGAEGSGYHEIYVARVGEADDVSSIEWQPLTVDSKERNIRPIILRNKDRRLILWNSGRYDSYTDYDLRTVGVMAGIRTDEIINKKED